MLKLHQLFNMTDRMESKLVPVCIIEIREIRAVRTTRSREKSQKRGEFEGFISEFFWNESTLYSCVHTLRKRMGKQHKPHTCAVANKREREKGISGEFPFFISRTTAKFREERDQGVECTYVKHTRIIYVVCCVCAMLYTYMFVYIYVCIHICLYTCTRYYIVRK